MDFSSVEDHGMITNVQRLFSTVKTKAPADVVSQTYSN
jgi:hypothetical protein